MTYNELVKTVTQKELYTIKNIIKCGKDKLNEPPQDSTGVGEVIKPVSSQNKENIPNDTSKKRDTPTKTISFTIPGNLENDNSNDENKNGYGVVGTSSSHAIVVTSLPQPEGTTSTVTPPGPVSTGVSESSDNSGRTSLVTSESGDASANTASAVVLTETGQLGQLQQPQQPRSPVTPSQGLQQPGSTPVKDNLEPGSPDKPIQVESSLLKNFDGVKIVGSCGAYFRVHLVPHILIYALTKYSIIQIESLFNENTKIDFEHADDIKNKCKTGHTFKFIIYLTDNILTLKWKVYPPVSSTT
ncbi:cysteine protease, putative, partial [Plasmodium malariae]